MKTPVPTFYTADTLGGCEGHPARRFTSAFGTAGCIGSALKDGNETSGAVNRRAWGGSTTPLAMHCASAAPVFPFFHTGAIPHA